jgi:predicted hotdog family 3-hydroxylacyl-ACP dehydratase
MIESINVLELIPQRPPFVMIDRLTRFDETGVTARFRVASGNIFVEDGKFTEAGIVESIAQTCAARMGYLTRLAQQGVPEGEKGKVKLGFIGSIKQLTVEQLPAVGDELDITITVKTEIGAVTLVDAVAKTADATIATGAMTISLTDIDSED